MGRLGQAGHSLGKTLSRTAQNGWDKGGTDGRSPISNPDNCIRCSRTPCPDEVREYGGCACELLFGQVCPSPYSNDFATFCSRCNTSIVSWEDAKGYTVDLCRCGLTSWEDWQKADAELEEMLRQQGYYQEGETPSA